MTWRERKREKTKKGTQLLKQLTTFLNSKLEPRLVHLITSKHLGVKRVKTLAIQVNSSVCGFVPQRVYMKFEDYAVTDHSLFFLSFELESFLNKSCFH